MAKNDNTGIFLGLAAAAGLFLFMGGNAAAAPGQGNTISFPPNASGSRGLRNKNPGNIRKTKKNGMEYSLFDGEVIPSSDNAFKQFETMPLGYRAIFRLIRSYILSGYDTTRKIISRYSPPSDGNATEQYIDFVVKVLKSNPAAYGLQNFTEDTKFSWLGPAFLSLVWAISAQENGATPVHKDIAAGYDLYKKSLNVSGLAQNEAAAYEAARERGTVAA